MSHTARHSHTTSAKALLISTLNTEHSVVRWRAAHWCACGAEYISKGPLVASTGLTRESLEAELGEWKRLGDFLIRGLGFPAAEKLNDAQRRRPLAQAHLANAALMVLNPTCQCPAQTLCGLHSRVCKGISRCSAACSCWDAQSLGVCV